MNYENFFNEVKKFLELKGWQLTADAEKIIFVKNYNPYFPIKVKEKYLIDDKKFLYRITNIFSTLKRQEKKYNSILNPYSDTDFIVAGLQTINPILKGEESLVKKSWYSFQPVIRLKEKELCGVEEGYLTSFINICTIDIDTSLEEYLENLDQWITILSKCSLHSSGMKIILKNKTTVFNGLGLELNYKGIDLGQANIYNINIKGRNCLISDFGCGYERILWAINGGANFYVPFISKYDYLFGDVKGFDRARTITLMLMCGIKPSSNNRGKHIKNLVSDVLDISRDEFLIDEVTRSYDFFSQFITPSRSLSEVLASFKNELLLAKKNYILKNSELRINPAKNNKSLEEICQGIIVKKMKNIQRDKEHRFDCAGDYSGNVKK